MMAHLHWLPWFAWRPIQMYHGGWRWLVWLERRVAPATSNKIWRYRELTRWRK